MHYIRDRAIFPLARPAGPHRAPELGVPSPRSFSRRKRELNWAISEWRSVIPRADGSILAALGVSDQIAQFPSDLVQSRCPFGPSPQTPPLSSFDQAAQGGLIVNFQIGRDDRSLRGIFRQ